jgi:hypothetical protein
MTEIMSAKEKIIRTKDHRGHVYIEILRFSIEITLNVSIYFFFSID